MDLLVPEPICRGLIQSAVRVSLTLMSSSLADSADICSEGEARTDARRATAATAAAEPPAEDVGTWHPAWRVRKIATTRTTEASRTTPTSRIAVSQTRRRTEHVRDTRAIYSALGAEKKKTMCKCAMATFFLQGTTPQKYVCCIGIRRP